ncbi:helix-turn-helix domain-containing protein [Kribbella shirazensis]|uniref:HTH-type transcriptional regulator/antitoxin HigA n=1 Tax=Kribbella shirazensis TaxID=1105143 RepID=A0A7X5V4V9_9ACTN|nr:HTH-type transcriptional regulator/antitoxin HigA [Kribbella shirazensis]
MSGKPTGSTGSTGSPRRAAVLPEVPAAIPHDYAVPPGELIRDELAVRGLSQTELAARTGLSTKHVNQVVKAVVPLSIDTALKIERAIGLPAQLLMTMEAQYQSNHGREVARQHLGAFQAWLRRFSRSDLVDRGVVDAHASVDRQIEQLLSFFGVASPDAYDHVYSEAALSFRRAQHLSVNRDATALWLRLGERQAEALDLSVFDTEAFVRLVFQLPDLTRLPIGEAFPLLSSRCAAVGVAVVYEPDVTGTRAYAATRWIGTGRPVVILSGRGRYEDGLWFHFFHECAHILLHPKRRSFVHLTEDGDDGDGAESEANDYARQVLLRSRQDEVLWQVRTKSQAVAVADQLGIDPGIVAGQVAYALGPTGFKAFAGLRRKIEL